MMAYEPLKFGNDMVVSNATCMVILEHVDNGEEELDHDFAIFWHMSLY